MVTADIDPLRDDGPEYVRRLHAAGVPAQYRNEPELVHGYLRARQCPTAPRADSWPALIRPRDALAQPRFQYPFSGLGKKGLPAR